MKHIIVTVFFSLLFLVTSTMAHSEPDNLSINEKVINEKSITNTVLQNYYKEFEPIIEPSKKLKRLNYNPYHNNQVNSALDSYYEQFLKHDKH